MVVSKQTLRPWMFRKELIVLYYGFRDKRTSLLAKLPAVISVLYLISPIDLIPDFIPFLGYIDDIVIVPLLLDLSIRLLPAAVRQDSLLRASGSKKKSILFSILAGLIVVMILGGIFFLVRYLMQNH